MGGGASANRTHYTPDELREEVGEDLGEELEAFITLAAKDDGDGQLMIAHADIINFIDGSPLDASMRTSRVVRVDGLIARVPAAELAAGVRAGKTTHDMKREAEFAQSRRYKDGDEVIQDGGSEPEYTVECFVARGGFGDVYKGVRALKQKEDKEKRDDRSFAMKMIRLEGKDRDARVRALRLLVEETHFALRVRRAAGVPSRAPRVAPRVTSFFARPLPTARRAPEPRRAARLLRDPAARRARAVQCHQRVYRRQARPASLHV